VKILFKEEMGERDMEDVMKEVEILSSLQH